MSIQIIQRWYDRLPEYERNLPILRIDYRAYTPTDILREARLGTSLGRELQRRLEEAKFTDRMWDEELCERRLIQLLRERPVEIAMLVPPGIPPTMGPEELIGSIRRRDEIGRMLLEAEEEHMRAMLAL